MSPVLASKIGGAAVLSTSAPLAQSAREIRGPEAVVPLAYEEPPAKIIVDPPVAEPLSHGRVVSQDRAENLRIVQVFGPNALDVSPRIGHIDVAVDHLPWHGADASGGPLIRNGFRAGPYKMLIELVDANHHPVDSGVVEIHVPDPAAPHSRSMIHARIMPSRGP